MSAEEEARRIAAGAPPSASLRRPVPAPAASPSPEDPLRLCVFATIALLGWLAGPVALVVFAAIGFAAYWTAWRGGLTRSRCFLRDTRLVLAYLGVLVAAGVAGVVALVAPLLVR